MSRTWTPEEKTRGLLALVMWLGNVELAAEALREQGVSISAPTLTRWKRTEAAEYNRLRDKHAPDLEEELIRRLRETALKGIVVVDEAIDRARERLEQNKDIYPHQTAANIAKTVGSVTEKMLVLTGRPAQITDHRTPDQIAKSLAAAGVLKLPRAPETDA